MQLQKMEKQKKDIRKFLYDHLLCNNGEKTELLIMGASNLLKKFKLMSIKVENVEIKAVDHVRNLGVIFDKRLIMDKQVNKMHSLT